MEKNKAYKPSVLQLLHNQVFGTKVRPVPIKLDQNESYKKSEHDPLINGIVYLADLFTQHCLPYRLSPVILSVPGVLLNIILFISLYTSSNLHRYHYIFWLVSRYFTYIFDMIDGKQARRNHSQSLARHFWDHWCDTINIALSSMIISRIYPAYFAYRLPSTVLMIMTPLGFYVNFFRYYCTGELIEPYTLHLWHYVYVLCLSVPVIVFDVSILTNRDYQVMIGTLSAAYAACFALKLVEYMTSIVKSPLFSIRLLVMLVLSPVVWVLIYTAVTINQSTVVCPRESLLFRSLAVHILCNYAMNTHYRQLVNASTPFFTAGSVVFILSLLILVTNDCQHRLIMLIVLVGVTLFIDIIRLTCRLKIFIDIHPEIGFPIFIVKKTTLTNEDHLTNNVHAHIS